MQIKCYINNYTQERTFNGENGPKPVREMMLTEVSDNALVEDKYANRFNASIFTHVDDLVLAKAVAGKTPFIFDLSFRVSKSKNGDFYNQRVTIEKIINV